MCLRQVEQGAKLEKWNVGEDFGEDIGNIVLGGYEPKLHDAVLNLLTKPRHFEAEVAVATRDGVIAYHSDTRLIVFANDGRSARSETKLLE